MAAMESRIGQSGAPGQAQLDWAGSRSWGAFLKEARRNRGVSQRALARELGVSQARVAQIETGASIPQVDTMAAYIAALGGELILRAHFDDSAAETGGPARGQLDTEMQK